MDNKQIIEFLREDAKQWYDTSGNDWLEEYLSECTCVFSEVVDNKRWWNMCDVVIIVNDRLLMYSGAETTGDASPSEKGWELNPSTFCEVEEYTETIVVKKYRKITVDNPG